MNILTNNMEQILQELSDTQFDVLCNEYSTLTNVITKIINVSKNINNLRQQKLNELHENMKLKKEELQNVQGDLLTLVKIPEWKRTRHQKNRIIYLIEIENKLKSFCDEKMNAFEVELDIDMRRDMTESIISIMSINKKYLYYEFFIMRESECRNNKKELEFIEQKSAYVDRCIVYLNSGNELDYDDNELIRDAHIMYHNEINSCTKCNSLNLKKHPVYIYGDESYFKVSDWVIINEGTITRALMIPFNITQYNNSYGFNLDYIGECLCRYMEKPQNHWGDSDSDDGW
jgi:hypothetical protein